MRIERKNVERVEVQDIVCGELFYTNNKSHIYMRTDTGDEYGVYLLCVSMEDGIIEYLTPETKVTAVSSHLVIDE